MSRTTAVHCRYEQTELLGPFNTYPVGTLGCEGKVDGRCLFSDQEEARAFCSRMADCTAVFLLPDFDGDFTPGRSVSELHVSTFEERNTRTVAYAKGSCEGKSIVLLSF